MWRKLIQALILSLVFGGLGFTLVFLVGGFRLEQLSLIRGLSWESLVWALLSMGASFIFAGLRLQHLCRRLGHRLKFRHAIRAHLLGNFSAAVTPSGHGNAPAIALTLQYQGLPSGQAWATSIAVFVADTLFLIYALPISLVFLRLHGLYPNTLLWNVLGLLAVILPCFIAYLFLFRLRWLTPIFRGLLRGPLLRFRKRALRFVDTLLESNRTFTGAPWWFYGVTQLLTLCSWLSFFLVLSALADGFGLEVAVLATTAWQVATTTLSFAVPTPGGSGFFELGTSLLFLNHGNDAAIPALLLAWRLITYYLFFLIGPLLGGYLLIKRLAQ
jgi:glycosyltransferase 2 family protein